MHLRTIAALTLFAVASLCAHAQPRFYLGADYAISRLDSGFEEQVAAQTQSSFVPSQVRADMSSDSGGRVFAGWKIAPWLALEADYTRVGTIETFYHSVSVHGAGFGFAETLTRQELDAAGLSLVASAPLTAALSFYGRAGVARTRLAQESELCGFSTTGGPPTPTGCLVQKADVEQTRPVAGVGLAYAFDQRWTMRLGWERYFGVGKDFEPGTDARGKFDVDRFAIGASFAF